jgi:transcriptional regulator with XRE-family HTH domain
MAKKFKQLKKKMSAEAQERAQIKTQVMATDMALAELRQAFNLSQEEMANVMKLKQPAISKIEKNTDMFISTLRRYIEAMGGELNITARFDDQEIRISQFEELHRGTA